MDLFSPSLVPKAKISLMVCWLPCMTERHRITSKSNTCITPSPSYILPIILRTIKARLKPLPYRILYSYQNSALKENRLIKQQDIKALWPSVSDTTRISACHNPRHFPKCQIHFSQCVYLKSSAGQCSKRLAPCW